MKIAVSGASGFIGTHLVKILSDKGHEIVRIERSSLNTDNQSLLIESLSGCSVVINLAGATINHRWTEVYKKELYSSRIKTTKSLVEAINSLKNKPELFISASAVGFYPSTGCFDEYSSVLGEGFLANLCDVWEKESQNVSSDVRLVNTRFGVVLAPKGGAFSKMILPTKFGIATVMGSGKQSFPWIDIKDLIAAMEHIIKTHELQGIVNLVSPVQISNRDFTTKIAKHYHSLLILRVPSAIINLAMGEAADFITHGQCVAPTKLLKSGFVFKSNSIDEFLQSCRTVK